MDKIQRIIIDVAGKEYEFAGGSSQPAKDSIGTEEIKDGSVQMEDLAPDIVTTPEEARAIVARAIADNE